MLHSKQAKLFIELKRLIQSADEAEQRAERRLYSRGGHRHLQIGCILDIDLISEREEKEMLDKEQKRQKFRKTAIAGEACK
jgi:hypothetical protein